jgi:hypothetical protein
MKECTKCRVKKELDEFCISKIHKHGRYPSCKLCKLKRDNRYYKTKAWLYNKMYNSQIIRSRERNYEKPSYTKQELIAWIESQTNFKCLRSNYVKSWFLKSLIPSVDRLDDYKTYTFDNIQLTTREENSRKASNDRKNWVNNKRNRAVKQFTLEWLFIKEHYSISRASRDTWFSISSIWFGCSKWRVRKWYKWVYST